MSAVAQLVGIVLVGLGVWLLWSPWAWIVVGGLLLVGPEVGRAVAGRRR